MVLIALIAYYQVLVTTRMLPESGKEYILSVQSLGAGTWELYRHVYFPGCLPEILTSLRLGLGTAMAVLFLTETYATQQGIGYFIMDSWPGCPMRICLLVLLLYSPDGSGFFIFFGLGEKRICLWKSLNK